MKDNFNLKQFLTENKLTNVAKLSEEKDFTYEVQFKDFDEVKEGDTGECYLGNKGVVIEKGTAGSFVDTIADLYGEMKEGIAEGYIDENQPAVYVEMDNGVKCAWTYGDDGFLCYKAEAETETEELDESEDGSQDCINDLKEKFKEQHSYIDVADDVLEDCIKKVLDMPGVKSEALILDHVKDYILSQGLADEIEQ